MRRVIAYVRVSTERQAEEGYSLESQAELLREYAARHDLQIVEEIVESESAWKPDKRPGFKRLLKELKAKRADAVLCYLMDRLVRNVYDYALLTDQLHAEIITAALPLPSDSAGELVGGIQAVVAKHYSQKISESASRGMKAKAKSGIYPSYAPTGYRNVKEPGGGIEPDPERAPLVQRMFEKYAYSNVSISDLVDWSHRAGLLSRGNKQLNKSTVHKMLTNPVHVGDIPWGGEIYRGLHEPLVSRALFGQVQRRLQSGGHEGGIRYSFPFRGLLFCGYCGCQLTAEIKKGKYVYYHCTHSRGPCEQPYHSQAEISELLAPVVDAVHVTPEIGTMILGQLQSDIEETKRARRAKLLALKSQKQDLDNTLQKGYIEKLEGRVDEPLWEKVRYSLQEKLAVIEADIQEFTSASLPDITSVQDTIELLERGPELYRLESDEEKAEHLRWLTSNCQVFAENVVPVYKTPFEAVEKGNKSFDWLPGEDSNLQPFG